MRRVLWVYEHAESFGGSLNSLLDCLPHIDPDRFAVTAALPRPGRVSRVLADRGIPVAFLPMPPAGKNLRYLQAIWRGWRWLRCRPIDLVYFADYASWRPALLLAAHVAGVPSVLHIRAPVDGRFVSDRCMQRAAAIVGNSRATVRALRGVVADARVHVVPNGIDALRFAAPGDLRGAFFPAQYPLVGFVGMFRPEKGIEYFLDMIPTVQRAVPEARFVAVGGESPLRDVCWVARMRQHAACLGIEDVVRFTGYRSDVAAVMRSLQVLVVPSLNEGFGRVIIEANTVGIPVVASNVGGIPEVVEDGVTGILVPARDSGALAAAVIRVLHDDGWRARVAVSAPERVRQRFAAAAHAATLQSIWKAVVGR